MKCSALLLAVAGVAAAAQHNGTLTTTRVVTAYTTWCPEATTVALGLNRTITVTEATMLTVTDCPCTIVEPCNTCVAPFRTPSATHHTASETELPSSTAAATASSTTDASVSSLARVSTAAPSLGKPVTPPSQAPPASTVVSGAEHVRAGVGLAVAAAGVLGCLTL